MSKSTEMPSFLDLSIVEQLSILDEASCKGPLPLANYAMTVLSTFRRSIRQDIPMCTDVSNNEDYWYFRSSLSLPALIQHLQDIKEPRLLSWAETLLTGCIIQSVWTTELQKELESNYLLKM